MSSVLSTLESSVTWVSPLYLLLKEFSKSFRKMAKRSGERFSPCLTPTLQAKTPEIIDCCFTYDLAESYML